MEQHTMLHPNLKRFYWSVGIDSESSYYRMQLLLNLYSFTLDDPFETWEDVKHVQGANINYCKLPYVMGISEVVWTGSSRSPDSEVFSSIEELAKRFEQLVH